MISRQRPCPRNALALSRAAFLACALLFVLAALLSGQPRSMRQRHLETATYWQDRQIAKGAAGPPYRPRAAWRDAPWACAIQRWDHTAFHIVNQRCANPFFDRVMPWVTQAGDAFTLAFFLIAVCIYSARRWPSVATTVRLGLIGIVLGLIPVVIKAGLFRYRPATLYPYDIVLLVRPLYGRSFPSGHAFAAFSVAVILARRHPVLAPWALGLALLVGISRVSVGVHWPADVLAGAALGAACGWSVVALHGRRAVTQAAPVESEWEEARVV